MLIISNKRIFWKIDLRAFKKKRQIWPHPPQDGCYSSLYFISHISVKKSNPSKVWRALLQQKSHLLRLGRIFAWVSKKHIEYEYEQRSILQIYPVYGGFWLYLGKIRAMIIFGSLLTTFEVSSIFEAIGAFNLEKMCQG